MRKAFISTRWQTYFFDIIARMAGFVKMEIQNEELWWKTHEGHVTRKGVHKKGFPSGDAFASRIRIERAAFPGKLSVTFHK